MNYYAEFFEFGIYCESIFGISNWENNIIWIYLV